MKKTILIALCLFSMTTRAQDIHEKEVPSPVKEKFKTLFPAASRIEWEKEDGNYEAEFTLNRVEMSAVLDEQGNVLETETEIKPAALPQAVSAYITKNYPGKKIREASMMKDAGGAVTYEAEISEGDLIFDDQGNFLRKKAEKEDDDKARKK